MGVNLHLDETRPNYLYMMKVKRILRGREMKEKLQIGIVGAGNVANSAHLPAWGRIGNVEVVAVCDVNKEFAERTAKRWKIPYIYTDFDELIEESRVKVVDICTPPDTHASLSIKAMDAGLNVILEKPMSMTIEESEEILREYQKRKDKVKLCVVHNILFTPPVIELKSLLSKKEVEILGVDIRWFHTPYDEKISDRNHWVHSLPGGRFGENLIHPVYILQDLIGELNVRDVYASKRGSYEWVKYDELYITFNSNKGFGSIYISFNSPRTGYPTIRVYGKNAILNFDGTNMTLLTQNQAGRLNMERTKDSISASVQILASTIKNAIRVVKGWRTGHETLFRTFVNSILNEKVKFPYSPEEAFKANKIFLEILDRLELGSGKPLR